MGIADPGFTTDSRIIEALNYAINHDCTHYRAPRGFDPDIFPRAIAKFYETTCHTELDPLTQIKATRGGQEALSLALHVTLKPGDEIIVPDPTYSSLIEKLPIFEAKPVFVPLIEEENWRLDLDRIESSISDQTKMIFVCNPNNPTGTVFGKKEIDALTDILQEYKHVSILSDECYSRILYDGVDFQSLINDDHSLRDRIFVANSLSKTFAMTGWRLGYIISGKESTDKIKKLSFEYSGGVSYALQYAGAVALSQCSSFVDWMLEELKVRRETMLKHLAEIKDMIFEEPQGGFEVFPNFSSYSKDSTKLSDNLNKSEHVETIPGARFGPSGEGHLRLVFCSENNQRLIEGVSRIGRFLDNS